MAQPSTHGHADVLARIQILFTAFLHFRSLTFCQNFQYARDMGCGMREPPPPTGGVGGGLGVTIGVRIKPWGGMWHQLDRPSAAS